jgi:dTDP-4-amino-4,6-dideoxygalactose transaminase
MPSASTITRNVPFFNYPYLFKSNQEELTKTITDVCSRGAYILQKDLEEFEANLAKFANVKYAMGVANGTDALIIAARAAGIKAGDEVIFCSHTYVATAASIYFAGGTPVAVECGSDHMIDTSKIEAAITPKTKAIMPTQLNGRTCNMDAIMQIADKHNLIVIEDAAQALGSKFKKRDAGTFGAAGTISFYPAKTLGCFGDGGAILTNDDEMYRKMSLLRDHGRNEDGDVVEWGLNSRLDNLQAAVLNLKLKEYSEAINQRRKIAQMYDDRLKDVAQLDLPPAPKSDSDHFDIYQNYELEADNRDALKDYLKENGVGTLIQWGGKAVHQFKDLGVNASLPYTERMISRSLMVPIYPGLPEEDVDYVCSKIKEFYAK